MKKRTLWIIILIMLITAFFIGVQLSNSQQNQRKNERAPKNADTSVSSRPPSGS